MKAGPTERTLQWLRKSENAGLVQVVEKWNPHSKTRHDLFGMFDVLQVKDNDMYGWQCTSSENFAARVEKLMATPALRFWLKSPQRHAVIIGWAKRGKAGKRKLWEPRIGSLVPMGNGTIELFVR